MRRRHLLLTAALIAGIAPAKGPTTMHHATGSFEVTITPEGQAPADGSSLPTARMGLLKTFTGPLAGTARGTMLTVGTPGPGSPAAYVAVDQFAGTLDGRQGGFVLLHRGTMDRAGHPELSVTIAPDSGTGALTGITGTLAIENKGGRHVYDLAYALPAG